MQKANQHKPDNSIIVFTLHKSASMLLYRLCDHLCRLSGIQLHSPNQDGGIDAHDLLTDKDLWHTHKGCFAPVRFYVDVPDFDNYRIILHLRDPRDVLVSMYYSYCYIHGGEMKGGTGYRKEMAERGIDSFVLNIAKGGNNEIIGDYGTGGHIAHLSGGIVNRYQDYIEHVLTRENVIFVRYEEMVLDFGRWLEKFIKPFPVSDKNAVISNLVANSQQIFPVRGKDVMQHIRHITPGDYRNKLKRETIEELNGIFKDVLDVLGYDNVS